MNRQKQLHNMAIMTMLAVLFLIWVGGTVRATGAGMGCPDWPTCFGRLVPPFSAADLPPDYRHTYARLGYDKMPFDPVKTWTEYLNRLTGTLIGLLSILTCVLAILAHRQDKALPWLAGGALGLVMLNGWLGAVVIDTNLHSAVVTTHMMLSFGVLFLLMAVVTRTLPSSSHQLAHIRRHGFLMVPIAMVITVVQTGLGAQVRERVDQMGTTEHLTSVVSWLDHVGAVLNVHMAGALIVIIINLWLMLRFFGASARVNRALAVLFLIVIMQILSGTILITLHLPTLVQPLHLLGASMLFTTQAFLLLVPTRVDDQDSPLHHGRPTTN